jgi:hypothetical protein
MCKVFFEAMVPEAVASGGMETFSSNLAQAVLVMQLVRLVWCMALPHLPPFMLARVCHSVKIQTLNPVSPVYAVMGLDAANKPSP